MCRLDLQSKRGLKKPASFIRYDVGDNGQNRFTLIIDYSRVRVCFSDREKRRQWH